MPARWSKWWWLQFWLVPTWSAEERLAAATFYGTFATALLLQVAIYDFYFSRLKFDPKVTLIAAIVVSLLSAVSSARGIANGIFSNTIKKGDEAAAKRVDGTVVLPGESPGIWWISYGAGNARYSREERFIVIAILLIASTIFVPVALYAPPHLMAWFDVSKRTALVAIMVTTLPLSFFIGRRLSALLWPDTARIADEKPWRRVNTASEH